MGLMREELNTGLRQFGNYEIISRVGQGGGGIVYRAKHHRLRRTVALKVMQVEHLATEAEVRRFEREAEAISQLDHPQIVTLYEFGDIDGRAFLAMEFMEGGDLSRYQKKHFPDGARTEKHQRHAVEIILQIARVAHHAHQRGFIHRDIKPGNILLDSDSVPHLSDFGLVKWDAAGGLTHSFEGMGTPSYMSPEQALGQSKNATVRSDTYGLGAVLYELLTGRAPFTGSNPLAIMRAVVESNPEALTKLNPHTPRDLEIICLKALEKDPKKRYNSAEELAEDLEHWLKGEPIQARAASLWERAVKWSRRNPVVATLGSLTILTLMIGIATTTWQWQRARRGEHETRLAYYSTGVSTAIQSSRDGRFNVARKILDSVKPTSDQKDLRGFEWRYARKLSHGPTELEKVFSIPAQEGGAFLISRDESWFAVPLTEQSLGIIDTRSRNIIAQLALPAMSALQLTQSGDGKFFAAAGYEGWRIWSAEDFKEIMVGTNVAFPNPGYLSRAMVQFVEGNDLLVCEKASIRRVSIARRSVETILKIPSAQATAAAASADGKRFAIATAHMNSSGYYTVDVWSIGKTAPDMQLPCYSGPVVSIQFSSDAQWLLFNGFTGERAPSVWNLKTRIESRDLAVNNQSHIFSLALDSEAKTIALGHVGGEVRVLTFPEGKLIKHFLGLDGATGGVLFSPMGKKLYARSGDRLRIWNLTTKPLEGFRSHTPTNFYYGSDLIQIRFNAESSELLTAGMDYGLRRFDSRSTDKIVEYPILRPKPKASVMDGFGLPLAFTDTTAAVFSLDEKLRIYDLKHFGKPLVLQGTKSSVIAATFSGDGRYLASGDLEGVINLWDLQTTNPPVNLGQIANQYPIKLFFLNTASSLVAVSTATIGEGGILVWNTQTKRTNFVYRGPSLTAADLSPDGSQLAVGGDRGDILVFETKHWRQIARMEAHAGNVTCLAWSADGATLASGGIDKSINLWTKNNWSLVTSLKRCSQPIADLHFAPDGTRLAAATIDHQIHLWEAPSHEALNLLETSILGP